MNATVETADDFFHDLLSDFLDESSQLMDRLNENLLQLDQWVRERGSEEEVIDPELLNDMFRSAHSIKGLSAMLGLPRINGLTHNIENVFDAARRGDLRIDDNVVEVIFGSIDRLGELISHLAQSGGDDLDCESQMDRIRHVLQVAGVEKKQEGQNAAEGFFSAAARPSSTLPEEPRGTLEPPIGRPEFLSEAEREAIEKEHAEEFESAQDEENVPGKYLSIFLDEAELAVDEIIDLLLGGETCDDPAAIKTLLITSHRIKGSAASVGLNRPARLAHLMEDILQAHRDDQRALSSDLTEAMLRCADGLRTYLAGLKTGEPQSEDFPQLAAELMIAERQSLADPAPLVEDQLAATDGSATLPSLSQAEAEAAVREAASRRPQTDRPIYLIEVQFDPQLPLIGLKAQLIFEKLNRLGSVFFARPEDSARCEVHFSQAVFGIESDRAAAQIDAALRVAGVTEVVVAALPDVEGKDAAADHQPGESPKPPAVPSAKREGPAAMAAPTLPSLTAPSRSAESPAKPRPAKQRPAESLAKPAETLRVDIDRLDQLMNLAGQLVINKARFAQLGEGLRTALPHKQCGHWLANTASQCTKLLQVAEAAPASPGNSHPADRDQVKSLARQMQNGLETIRRELSRLEEIRTNIVDFFDAVHQLERVANGIQKTVMDTRMVPVGPLFGRFKRVVRDISRNGDKQIQLEILGEKTELDKRMIDELGDPLIHMVRNSADHGIESPADRLAAGKPEFGTITLNAFHRGNSIVIQVTDDGRGLSREKILAKAIEKNVIQPAEAEKLTPLQVYQLIWEPGFSTAEKVTEISGRGMGMDIVRSKIAAINGVVEVDSHEGRGTVFTIKLPLTMAILPSLMARIDGDLFSIPVDSIIEIVKVPQADVRPLHGKPTAMVRGRVVSIVRLGETFHWNGPPQGRELRSNDITMVILGQDGREIGLVVDGLLGEEDVVVKSLAENYRNIEGIAGACILGNGRVALILDPAAVIDLATLAGRESRAH